MSITFATMGSLAEHLATSLDVVGEWQSSIIKTYISKTEDSSRPSIGMAKDSLNQHFGAYNQI